MHPIWGHYLIRIRKPLSRQLALYRTLLRLPECETFSALTRDLALAHPVQRTEPHICLALQQARPTLHRNRALSILRLRLKLLDHCCFNIQRTMASQEVSSAERIRELSAINADIPVMLEAAGKAINALTNSPLTHSGDGDDTAMEDGDNAACVEQRKAAFADHAKAYYTTLQAIIARLRRQAYALEEAGIIAAEAPNKSATSTNKSQAGAAPARGTEKITNGGLGSLDVGWLNSRGNKVGAEKESELMEEAKKLLEETLSCG